MRRQRDQRPRIDILYLCVIILGVAIIFLGQEMKRMNAEIKKQFQCAYQSVATTIDMLEIQEGELPETSTNTFFDVPLDRDLQNYIFDICEKYGVNPELIVSMIFHESNFDCDVIGTNSSGYSYGLMQIMPRWNYDRMERLGCFDLLDPYQNICVGVDLIAEYIKKDRGIEWALMAYNGGPSYANRKAAEGIVSSYATRVMDYANGLYRASEGLRTAA